MLEIQDSGLALGDLQASAPLRDFAPSLRTDANLHTCVIPERREDGLAWAAMLTGHDSPVLATILVSAVSILLARHARRRTVTFGVETPWERGARLLSVNIDPSARLHVLQDEIRRQIASRENNRRTAPTPTHAVLGCLVDLRFRRKNHRLHNAADVTADLCFVFRVAPHRLHARIVYRSDIYLLSSIEPLARQFAHLLGEMTTSEHLAMWDIPSFGQDERARILHGFNSLRVAFPPGATMASLIAARCAEVPGAVCAIQGDRKMTFSDLASTAGRTAGVLEELGVRPGQFVAVLDHRGLDFAVAMLATWEAGAAYIPIDPDYPDDRVHHMLSDSAAKVVIAGVRAFRKFRDTVARCAQLRHIICLSDDLEGQCTDARLQVHGPTRLYSVAPQPLGAHRARATDPAYMLYTSGSTGRPKGAVVRHDGAVNHLLAQVHALGEEAVSRFLQSAPSSSDISVWQFAAPLALGGTSVIADNPMDVERLHTLVREHDLSIIELVPAALNCFLEYARALPTAERALPSLRWAMVTGESVSVDLVNAWLSLYPEIPVVNAYGPTEAADDICQAIIREPLPLNRLNVSIGRPLANLSIYVLDEDLRPVPVGAPGEICVAGIGVGSGYWRQPEKTRRAFVPNPFSAEAGPTIYRTGDLGRWRDDGTLECLGRIDHQIQLRGFRIELPEIEHALRNHSGVNDAVVQLLQDPRGDGRLIGYFVSRGEPPGNDELKAHLAATLPAHMVPSAFVALPRLPLNPAGKVDRKALAAIQPGAVRQERVYLAPRTPAELALAQVWRKVLAVEQVSVNDDFFALGGDSLSAAAIAVGARAFGLHLRITVLLTHPIFADSAAHARPLPTPVCAEETACPAMPALKVMRVFEPAEHRAFLASHPECEDIMPLTPSQQALFVHWLLARDKRAYIDQYCWTIDGELNLVAFEAAWNRLLERHSGLRTCFQRAVVREPAQLVYKRAPIAVAVEDYSKLDLDTQSECLNRLLRADIDRGFDLAKPPVMRVLLVKLAPTRHYLVWTHHHIVLDGWSLSLAMNEVLIAYDAYAAGREPIQPEPIGFRRYVDWLSARDAAPAKAFWRDQLCGWQGMPPWGRTPAGKRFGYGHIESRIDQFRFASLLRRSSELGVTPTTLLEAAWALVLASAWRVADVTFGVVSSGRDPSVPGIDAMIGMLVTTSPLRVHIADPSERELRQWLREIQQRAVAVREYEVVPLHLITHWIGSPPGRPLFESLFVMSNYPGVETKSDAKLSVSCGTYRTVPAFPISVIMLPEEDLQIRINYDRSRFDSEQATQLLEQFAAYILSLAEGQDPRSPKLHSAG